MKLNELLVPTNDDIVSRVHFESSCPILIAIDCSHLLKIDLYVTPAWVHLCCQLRVVLSLVAKIKNVNSLYATYDE